MTPDEVKKAIQGRLIVSCQPSMDDLSRNPQLMASFAVAAVAGGAAAIRADTPADVRAIREVTTSPIIGIHKVRHHDGPILITPSFDSAKELIEAGADMIALECTERGQDSGALDRIREIHARLGVPVLADVANVEQALAAIEAGADFVLSTLRGYTEQTDHLRRFDRSFIEDLVRLSRVPVIAEGHVSTPDEARQAIAAGALAVVVGTAITRPKEITRGFAVAVEQQYARKNATSCAIGVDLGGTRTKYGIVRSDGAILFKFDAETPSKAGAPALLDHLKRGVETLRRQAADLGCSPVAIGIATAGWVEESGRVVFATGNLPGWAGTPVGEEVARVSGLPVSVINDANSLAIAEKHFGAARFFDDFACLTLGTGLGGACYVKGALNQGPHWLANQLGHFPLVDDGAPCNCGSNGCLEPYVNAAALVRYAGNSYTSPAQVITAANNGDRTATVAIQTLAKYLAKGCAALVAMLDPQALILGGGLVENNPLLLEALCEELPKLVHPWKERDLQVILSQLGYHGGVVGAAALALDRLSSIESAECSV